MSIDISKLVLSPHLEARLDAAIKMAERAANGPVITEDDLDMHLRIKLSQHYGIPIFDPYFEKPVDVLAFEAFLITELAKRENQTPGEMIQENSEEAADYASQGWDDAPEATLSQEEKNKMAEFMSNGQFIGEQS